MHTLSSVGGDCIFISVGGSAKFDRKMSRICPFNGNMLGRDQRDEGHFVIWVEKLSVFVCTPVKNREY